MTTYGLVHKWHCCYYTLMKWEICRQHVIDQYLGIVYQLPNFVCSYMMIVLYAYSMLQWLVHDYYARNAWLPVMRLVHRNDMVINTYEVPVCSQHITVVAWPLHHSHNIKLPACYNTLPNLDCEHGVLYYRNYRSQICLLASLVRYSFRFFAFLLTLHFGFLSVSTYLLHLWAAQICSPFICRSFLVLNWEAGQELGPTHLSVEIVKFLQLPNPY